MKKKFLLIGLATIFTFTFISCSNPINNKGNSEKDNSTTSQDNNKQQEENKDKESSSDSNSNKNEEKTNDNNNNLTTSKQDNSTDNNTDKNNTKDTEKNSPSDEKISKKETCRLFFFDKEKLEEVYVDKEIEVIDKAKINALTKAHKEYKDNNNFIPLSDKANVTSAKVDGDILKIYFRDNFIKDMTLGTATESGLIQSLVDTYGYNAKVNKVAIYMNNELYKGPRGELPEGYYNVNTKQVKSYKK